MILRWGLEVELRDGDRVERVAVLLTHAAADAAFAAAVALAAAFDSLVAALLADVAAALVLLAMVAAW